MGLLRILRILGRALRIAALPVGRTIIQRRTKRNGRGPLRPAPGCARGSHYPYPCSHYQYRYSHYQYPCSHYQYRYSHYQYPFPALPVPLLAPTPGCAPCLLRSRRRRRTHIPITHTLIRTTSAPVPHYRTLIRRRPPTYPPTHLPGRGPCSPRSRRRRSGSRLVSS